MRLYGRDAETAALDELLDQARKGASGALVLRGAPGIGKTALLEWATEQADGFRGMRGTGIEEESELPFAGLHLLLRSGLDRLAAIPAVQAEALRGALGLAKAGSPDRFLVGLAVLSLFADLADDQPLLCLVDDAHWLDRASADARTHLAAALETFERLGALPWADRARSELTATGTTIRPAGPEPGSLTPQERQIVRLAARGLSNKDIAAQLFLSPRTVGHHLYKAYPKLGVSSRGQLAGLELG